MKRLSTLLLTIALVAAAHASRVTTEHWQDGGQRARWGFTGTSSDFGYATIHLPRAAVVYMVPFTVPEFDETEGAAYQMTDDGTVTIAQGGYFDVTCNIDWPGNHGVDVNARKVLIQRVPLGVAPPPYVPGAMTQVKGPNSYDSIGARDIPGSDAPRVSRATLIWQPGLVPAGTTVGVDVPLANPPVPIAPGDVAQVGFTAGGPGLLLWASVTGPNVVHVSLSNLSGGDLAVPTGTLNVLAQTTASATGNSSDAWTYANSPTVMLMAGEKVFLSVRSDTQGDFLQIDNQSFCQITRRP